MTELLIPLIAVFNRTQGIGREFTGYWEDWLPHKLKKIPLPQEGITLTALTFGAVLHFSGYPIWAVFAGIIGPFFWRSFPSKGELINLRGPMELAKWPIDPILKVLRIRPDNKAIYKLSGQAVRSLLGAAPMLIIIFGYEGIWRSLLFMCAVPACGFLAYRLTKDDSRAWGWSEYGAGAALGASCLI